MNSEAVKIDAHRFDRGGIHRAIDVARLLCAQGIWNGQDYITFFDPYQAHNKVWGVVPEPLKPGVDYIITALVLPNTPPDKYQVEEDGDILWAN